jgi:hypothetical protein
MPDIPWSPSWAVEESDPYRQRPTMAGDLPTHQCDSTNCSMDQVLTAAEPCDCSVLRVGQAEASVPLTAVKLADGRRGSLVEIIRRHTPLFRLHPKACTCSCMHCMQPCSCTTSPSVRRRAEADTSYFVALGRMRISHVPLSGSWSVHACACESTRLTGAAPLP